MNKLKAMMTSVVMSLIFCNQSMAAFTLNSTRFIYNEGQKNISFEVKNNVEKTYGGQVWTENEDPENKQVYIVPQPPFFRVGANQLQIIRLMKVDESLPADRESLFWLNVQEIPPKPEVSEGGSALAIAMNTKVKLFYRPASIMNDRKDAEKALTVRQVGNETWLKNPTPYYMAIVSVKSNGKAIKLSEKMNASVAKLAPFSEVSLGTRVSGNVSVDAVNDWGGVQSFNLKQQD